MHLRSLPAPCKRRLRTPRRLLASRRKPLSPCRFAAFAGFAAFAEWGGPPAAPSAFTEPSGFPSATKDAARPRRKPLSPCRSAAFAEQSKPPPLLLLFAKGPAWLACSVVNVLATARFRCQLFASSKRFRGNPLIGFPRAARAVARAAPLLICLCNKTFRRLRTAAKGVAFGNHRFCKSGQNFCVLLNTAVAEQQLQLRGERFYSSADPKPEKDAARPVIPCR